jgi:hypothetical protein
VDRNTTLRLKLAPGGGQAIRIRPATEDEAAARNQTEAKPEGTEFSLFFSVLSVFL